MTLEQRYQQLLSAYKAEFERLYEHYGADGIEYGVQWDERRYRNGLKGKEAEPKLDWFKTAIEKRGISPLLGTKLSSGAQIKAGQVV